MLPVDHEIPLIYFQLPQLRNLNILPVSTIVYFNFILRSGHVLHSFLQVGGCGASCPEVAEQRLKKLEERCRISIIPWYFGNVIPTHLRALKIICFIALSSQ